MIERLMAWTRLDRLLPRGAILLALLTFGGYAMGLVRDRIFARTFGAGTELDAYNAAFVLPELALDVLVAGGLTAPFVPIFLGLRDGDGSDRAAQEFGQTILTLTVLVMAIASAILFLLAPITVSVIAPGFESAADQDLYTGLFRVMCITPVIFAASIALGEVLVADRRFLFYGLAPLLYNGGIVVGSVLFADSLGIYGAALGAFLGALLHLGIRVAGIRRTGFRIRARLAVRTAAVREFIKLMLPKMASHPVDPLTFLYFTALATHFGAGNVSAVSFARNFQSVPVSLIGVSIAVAAFPVLSAAAASGDRQGFARILTTNLATTAILTGVAALGLFVLSRVVISVLLGGGAFDAEDVTLTAGLLAAFAISIPLESLTHLLARAFYATHNTVIPVVASVAALAVIVVSGEALGPRIGVTAIPIAFTAGSLTKVSILALLIRTRVRRIGVSPPR
ncbi:MAG: murein biosynthesis integral membrane protein MurJ [Candidatus Limnocylindrales bacterium]